jgi:hypothetical protein
VPVQDWLVSEARNVCPDVCVIRGVPEFVGDATDVLTNPAVIVEVLSDATERFDRGKKFAITNRHADLHARREHDVRAIGSGVPQHANLVAHDLGVHEARVCHPTRPP